MQVCDQKSGTLVDLSSPMHKVLIDRSFLSQLDQITGLEYKLE